MARLKVLWYSDTPTRHTGFGVVVKNVLRHLHKTGRYDFTVMGINQWDYYDQKEYPYVIYAAGLSDRRDPFGRERFKRFILEEEFDILFTFNDYMILNYFCDAVEEARRQGRRFSWITHSPLDAEFVNEELLRSFTLADFPVCYTDFQRARVATVDPDLAERSRVIYHGTDISTFYPLPQELRRQFRRDYFKVADDQFLIVNVNMNQWRKDLGRTLYAFKLFSQEHPDAYLYIHAPIKGPGGVLDHQAVCLDVDIGRLRLLHPDENADAETMNRIYNAADVVVSTTTGEGWGLSTTEAMATRTPVLMPRNTSLVEILGPEEERGFLAECGTTSSEWTIGYGFSNFPRPLVNVDSFLAKLEEIHAGGPAVEEKISAAYEWARSHTWAQVCKEWDQVFTEAARRIGK